MRAHVSHRDAQRFAGDRRFTRTEEDAAAVAAGGSTKTLAIPADAIERATSGFRIAQVDARKHLLSLLTVTWLDARAIN